MDSIDLYFTFSLARNCRDDHGNHRLAYWSVYRYYTFLFDVAWQTEPIKLSDWWESYALQRYGKASAAATQAWALLAETVYGTTQEKKSMYHLSIS